MTSLSSMCVNPELLQKLRHDYFSDPYIKHWQDLKFKVLAYSKVGCRQDLTTGKLAFVIDQVSQKHLDYIDGLIQNHQKTYYPELFKE